MNKKIYFQKYYQKNKIKIRKRRKEYDKRYYQKNKKKIIEYKKNYAKNHKLKIRKIVNKYRCKRRKKDINYKILWNLRSRINKVLKGKTKSELSKQLIGCSIEYLNRHLQKQFKPGMTWLNYGKNGWHIDHINPCCKFDLSKPEEQKKCFHYTNLQPLWAEENLKKGRN